MSAQEFPAAYRGKCCNCGEWFAAGTPIIRQLAVGRSGYSYAHSPECPEVETPIEISTQNLPLCSSCFLYHRGECL